jgi:hypothetical protein
VRRDQTKGFAAMTDDEVLFRVLDLAVELRCLKIALTTAHQVLDLHGKLVHRVESMADATD